MDSVKIQEKLNALEKQLERIKASGKKYWFDFEQPTDFKDALVERFGCIHFVECRPCSMHRHWDITITIS
jgi:hypothetical protein